MFETINFKLYLITDRKLFESPDKMLEAVEKALQGGVKAVQLREKDLKTRELLGLAYEMRALTARYGAKLFVNDRVDIALAVEADGVQLGGMSIPVQAAHKASKGRLLVSVSTHSVQEAQQAVADEADLPTRRPCAPGLIYPTWDQASIPSPSRCKLTWTWFVWCNKNPKHSP